MIKLLDPNQDISIKILRETLERAANYLEANGGPVSAYNLRILSRVLYRRPHICELVQKEMDRILTEDLKAVR